ncbi:hypothetical protein LO772_19675 [Yinghuangia sp. ASG 101]|uniref:hypothetical protein n=1 Tax=Yinghuangia sp. ASG 101 TaxID=2896848 RepID=UPI001E4CD90D|nr:hypothetical protein [Yinghuangia sp. ASG 101]UGQ09173.1 hypothetical protein LO772_19675 [Yinghuangia sp. ASG 101]
MSRGRHRQSSALLRISVLIAVLAPAFVAVLLAAVGSGAGVLRIAVLCAVASAAALVALLRQSRRNYGQDLARRRRERERLAATAAEIRDVHEQALARTTALERELVTIRERMAVTRARLNEAEARAEKSEARAAVARERAADADRRIAAAQARARQADERAGQAASRVRELEARTKELTARSAELDFGRATLASSRPVRLTAELFAGGAAALRGLERSAAAKTAKTAKTAQGAARAEPIAAAVADAKPAAPAEAAVTAVEVAEAGEAVEAAPQVAEPAEAAGEASPGPVRPAPLAPRAVIPAARSLRPRRQAAPSEERDKAGPDAGAATGVPVEEEAPVPVTASGADVPCADPVGRPAVGEGVEAPAADAVAAPVGALPVPRRPAEVAVPVTDVPGVELDFGVDALEPAVAALPPDEAVARIVREVANTVRTVNERMSRSGDASSFDFFGRSEADAEEPGAEPAASESASESVDEPEAAHGAATAESVAETRSHRVVRDASARFEAVSQRPLVTHEPRTGRPIPVDLTAHDDTEQLPKIVDTRKHA